MMPETSSPRSPALGVFRAAALFTFLAVAMGSVVCATGSGAACATWPGCQPGQIAPQWQLSPIIEFTHRVVAMASGPLVLAAALLSRRVIGSDRWVRALPWLALAGAIAAGVFGRLVVLSHIPTWMGAVDLTSALTAMTVMAIAAVRASGRCNVPAISWGPVLPLAAASVVVLVALHVTAVFAAGKGSYTRCMGWPLWRMIDADQYPTLQAARLGLAGIGAVLVVATAVVAARTERLRRWGVAVGVLFAAEMLLGLVIRGGNLTSAVAAAYSMLAVALLWCLGLMTGVCGLLAGPTDDAEPETPRHHDRPAGLSV